ncbi:MAG: hypothetical protein K0U74_05940 [Alphaproteobacteria bacterium]|nr:hypothetical protein [Alphaproteobacteria bacterium]
MTDKKNNPGKGKPSQAASAGGKKPHATLDLKATEIKASGADSGAAGVGAKPAGDKTPPGSSDKSKTSTPLAGSKPAATGSGSGIGASSDAKPSGLAGSTTPDDKKTQGGGKPSQAKAGSGASKPRLRHLRKSSARALASDRSSHIWLPGLWAGSSRF